MKSKQENALFSYESLAFEQGSVEFRVFHRTSPISLTIPKSPKHEFRFIYSGRLFLFFHSENETNLFVIHSNLQKDNNIKTSQMFSNSYAVSKILDTNQKWFTVGFCDIGDAIGPLIFGFVNNKSEIEQNQNWKIIRLPYGDVCFYEPPKDYSSPKLENRKSYKQLEE